MSGHIDLEGSQIHAVACAEKVVRLVVGDAPGGPPPWTEYAADNGTAGQWMMVPPMMGGVRAEADDERDRPT